MANIVILGAGVMGTAFSIPPAENSHNIYLVGTHLDKEWINAIQETGIHPKLQVKLPDNVHALHATQLHQVLSTKIDMLILGVSSPGIGWALEQLTSTLSSPVPIILLTKGLASFNGTISILPALVQEKLHSSGHASIEVGAIGGPCIAGELACKRDTSVIASSTSSHVTERLIRLTSTPYYHIRKTEDLIGLEFCAAFKNFYTLAIGSANGRLEKEGIGQNGAKMFNLTAGIFTQTLIEMSYLVQSFGGSPTTVRGLAGAGDLYVTSMAGRNGRMGALLGQGISYLEAKSFKMANETVEGADLALTIGPSLRRMLYKNILSPSALPLAHAIIKSICENMPLQIPWEQFYRN